MFSTDVLAVASIAGCTAVSLGATASLLAVPDHVTAESECTVVVEDHESTMTFSRDGEVFVVVPGGAHEVSIRADGDAEKCRRKRRRRHRHRGDVERTREIERAFERAEHARERAERVRVRVIQRQHEIQSRALEEASRELESVMEGELRHQAEVESRRMEMLEREMRQLQRELESRERLVRRIRR